jgi:excisionase family DNA binding protein
VSQRENDELLTIEQASATLGLKPVTLRAWMARRKVGYVRLGRSVRIPYSEIDRLIERGTVPAREERP